MIPRKSFLFLILVVFAYPRLLSQSTTNSSYVVEIKLDSSQTLESVSEMYPFLNVTNLTDNTLIAEVPPKYFNSIRSGEIEFKILSTPKSNYVARSLQKAPGAPNSIIQNLVNGVSSDTIRTNILALQNFGTRYEYTPQQDSAGVYIYNQFMRWGLQAEYDPYTFGTTTLYDLDFIDENAGWLVGNNGLIVKTTNGGESWDVQTSGTSLNLFGVDFINSLTGWAVGNSGLILKTTNGGESWTTQTSGQITALYDVNFVTDQLGLIVGTSGRILRTTDGGTNWVNITSGTTQTLRELQFVDQQNAWAVGTSGTIRRTTDGGLTWSAQVPPAGVISYLRAVCFIDNQNGWSVGEGLTILKTTNGGTNWIQQYAPPGVENTLRGVSFINSLTGWVVDYAGVIIKTTDGGDSWNVQYSHLGWNAKLTNVKATSNNLVTVCGVAGNLYKSTNSGLNWLRRSNSLPPQYLHTSNNIVATIPGTISPEKECVIVAHYDSYSTIDPMNTAPGANDNATGTVAVMEAARLCAGKQFENTVKFIAVSGEEMGMFGSDYYAFKARDESRNIIGVVNGDMIGYPTTSDTARLITGSYQTLNRLVDSAAVYNQRYGIGLTLVPVIDNTGASDYGPFALAGYDALDIAEGTAEEIWGGADPYYHKPTDTYDKLHPGMIKKGVQLMLATVTELGKPLATGTITGIIYNDLNRDSSSTGDEALAGWVVKLYKDGIIQGRKITSIDGPFSFDNLMPGIYTLEESLYVGWIQSLPRFSDPHITLTTYGENAAPRAYQLNVEAGSFISKSFGNYPSWIMARSYPVSSGWNMISIPLEPVSKLKIDLFPTASSSAYAYGSGYIEKDALECGIGYWLKFNSTQQITITGLPFAADTIDLTVGWNLIGSFSDSISVSLLATDPDGILTSSFYGYENGYKIVDVLNPMRGYWIKATSPGKLILAKLK